MKIYHLALIVMLSFSTACAQRNSPQAHERANQCYTGSHWEACGASGEQPPQSMFIHKPSKGCPASYLLSRKLFAERDGTYRDGCVKKPADPGDPLPLSQDGTFTISIDELYGGESLIDRLFMKLLEELLEQDDGTKRKI